MREIKFRAWDKRRKEMSEVTSMTFAEGAVDAVRLNGRSAGDGRPIYTEIEGVHLMQFTGLHDKNGIDVYEGDIVSFDGNMTADNSLGVDPNGFIYSEEDVMEVVYGDEVVPTGFTLKWPDNLDELTDAPWKYKRDTYGLLKSGNCEVIGNIYENPELLEDNLEIVE